MCTNRKDSTAPLENKIAHYVSHLASLVTRGNYYDGIPVSKVGVLGKRKKYWDMLTISQKQTYLRMMAFIVKDKHDDWHLGDANFQNTMIGGRVPYINSMGKLMSEAYLKDPFFEWPEKLNERIEVSKSDFKYGTLMQVAATYMNVQKDPNSRSRRYSYNCPSCKTPFSQDTVQCSNCFKELNPEGYPKVVPDNAKSMRDSFMQYDQIASGIEEAMLLPGVQQEELIIENVIGNTNSGYPFFEKQQKDKIKKMWYRFLKFLHLPEPKNDLLTIDGIFSTVRYLIKQKLNFPYVLFYRTQGGKDATKHRCVFGAPFVEKLVAAVISIGKEIGYYRKNVVDDDPVFSKHIWAVGKLPIVAQSNWDEMFTAIKKRIPQYQDGKMKLMSSSQIHDLFGVKLAPGEYEVNVIGDDFPGFDTGQIVDDFEGLRKHKKLGWLFGYMIDDMAYSEVWTANKILYDIQFKSGFPMTSEFGSFLHRKANYNAAAASKSLILANINLSDDDIIFTIGLTPKIIDDYLKQFGLKIKVDESYNYKEHPIVGFLKVLIGYVHRDDRIGVVGDIVSRYYGMCHSERVIEQEVGSIDFSADVRGIYKITGIVEVDALLSKYSSYGDENAAIVRVLCEINKDTDLGQKAILAMISMKSNMVYKPYRSDIEISFPPNWLANVNVADLVVDLDDYK